MAVLLQVALDVVDLRRAVGLAASLADCVDRIELGTPLLLTHGASAIDSVRAAAPHAALVADCKTMDCGAVIGRLAMAHGADGLIVQGAAPRATLLAAAAAVQERGGFMMVDDLGVDDLSFLMRKIEGVPVAHLILHAGKDEQAHGVTPAERLREAADTPGLPPLAVAGGIDESNLGEIIDGLAPSVVIVGEAIYASSDPRRTALRLRELLRGWTAVADIGDR